MTLRTGCIKNNRKVGDGLLISIMSRHTLNDGRTPDTEITEASFDEWWPELAPSDALLGWYYRQPQPPSREIWETFEEEFLYYLHCPTAEMYLFHLAELARYHNVKILYIEPTPEHCHRRLVAEACRRVDPSLKIIIE
jgi:uncharacterized protein YeaO (DUF488 family)